MSAHEILILLAGVHIGLCIGFVFFALVLKRIMKKFGLDKNKIERYKFTRPLTW